MVDSSFVAIAAFVTFATFVTFVKIVLSCIEDFKMACCMDSLSYNLFVDFIEFKLT
jgi:hypothetical protein